MKPKNFPERKNARHKVALLYRKANLEHWQYTHSKLNAPPIALLNEIATLKERIVDNARDVHTKKRRTGKRRQEV